MIRFAVTLVLALATAAAVGCGPTHHAAELEPPTALEDAGTEPVELPPAVITDRNPDPLYAQAGGAPPAAGAGGAPVELVAGSSGAAGGAAGMAGGGSGAAGSVPAGAGGAGGAAGSAGAPAAGAAGGAPTQPARFCKITDGGRFQGHTIGCEGGIPGFSLRWRLSANSTTGCGTGEVCATGAQCWISKSDPAEKAYGVCL